MKNFGGFGKGANQAIKDGKEGRKQPNNQGTHERGVQTYNDDQRRNYSKKEDKEERGQSKD